MARGTRGRDRRRGVNVRIVILAMCSRLCFTEINRCEEKEITLRLKYSFCRKRWRHKPLHGKVRLKYSDSANMPNSEKVCVPRYCDCHCQLPPALQNGFFEPQRRSAHHTIAPTLTSQENVIALQHNACAMLACVHTKLHLPHCTKHVPRTLALVRRSK